ncbi:MAG: PEP-CTERM-box response regulator transcription factor [Deltaproteobacteria bacterium]|nr:PEP-CTERM-box response regulator transcription factor [Deltaproteobacteria bacterium]
MDKQKLLIIEREQFLLIQLRQAFNSEYDILEAQNEIEAIEKVRSEQPDVVILDPELPPNSSDLSEAFKILKIITDISPTVNILFVADAVESQNAYKAIQLGAFDFFTKPFKVDELRVTVKRAFHLARLEKENNSFINKGNIKEFGKMPGGSRAMKKVYSAIQKIAHVDIPVLILGESGTGKDLAARAIHTLSTRKKGPLVAINCGAIPEQLLEAELFGFEKGAFTGAVRGKKGKIEYSNGGTLFLDEIGELSLSLQVKLLRFLQDHLVEHIGSHKKFYVDTRIIAATNRDIEGLIKSGDFREDLYFRLAVVNLEMPPLRERGNDVLVIAELFLKRFSKQLKKKGSYFMDDALAALMEYDWPGNIRELENKVKRALIMAEKKEISRNDLDIPASEWNNSNLGLKGARDACEKELIEITLEKENGMISRSAKELKISRQYLTRLITKHAINPKMM